LRLIPQFIPARLPAGPKPAGREEGIEEWWVGCSIHNLRRGLRWVVSGDTRRKDVRAANRTDGEEDTQHVLPVGLPGGEMGQPVKRLKERREIDQRRGRGGGRRGSAVEEGQHPPVPRLQVLLQLLVSLLFLLLPQMPLSLPGS
jgi:hypothetical protein